MKNKKSLLMILALLSVIVITVGVSFAFFNYAKLGTTENSITSGTITFLYTEVDKVGAGIKLENAIPITDTAGKMLTGSGNVFNFKVTSTTNMNASIPYEVTARMKEGSDLDPNVVKVYLTKGETEEEVLLDKYGSLTQTSRVLENVAIEKTIYTGKVPSNTSNYEETFKLRMWVDSETDFSSKTDEQGNTIYPYNNKTFTLMVNVYADAKIVNQEEIDMENTTGILSISAGEQVLDEVNEKYDYTTTLDEGTTQTTINVETKNPNAKVEIEKIDSLAKSNNIQRLSTAKTVSLTAGENYFKVTVKSENNKTEDEYILMIKVGKDKTNTLSSLSVSDCTLSPAFNSEITAYTCEVENEVESVEVIAETTSSLSPVTGLGKKELVVGKNTINVVVTAEDGITKTYTVEVTRKASNDATLKSLSVSGYNTIPAFNLNTILYRTVVPYNVTSITVNATKNNSEASVKVTGNTNLQLGTNTVTIEVTAGDKITKKTYTLTVIREEYKEVLLNGADPVLSSNLVPVTITSNGTVKKADLGSQWYDYETKQWANAVVLKNNTAYSVGATIPESNIESYFVWIPKYAYKLWDLGNYTSLTTVNNSKPHAIPIRFGLTNTSDSKTGECTTPTTAGASGNCNVGDYMTHPAFLAFDSNGMWVGKFETGYNGATSTLGAEINSSDSSKIIIKPNVYSWRNATVGNIFKASYNYLRSDESHAIKNTEWGAVAYLAHSIYGTCTGTTCTEIRINNNSAYITGYAGTEQPTISQLQGPSVAGCRYEETSLGANGTYTLNYLNANSNLASTTQNYTGIYDISGGAWEYTMGYTTSAATIGGASEITSLYSDFFTNSKWNKYYDKYASTSYTSFNNRILGDSTGEMGPFAGGISEGVPNYYSSWYEDYAVSAVSIVPWFARGGQWEHGTYTGSFAFYYISGGALSHMTYRIVLTPTK